jgi:very-short-patch-repair endonuclease
VTTRRKLTHRRTRSPGRGAQQIATARDLRRNETELENIAWQLLRRLRAQGLTFRRQHPIDRYVTDFCCPQLRLVVELEGSAHSQPSRIRHDERRTAHLEQMGYKVVRIPNGMVLQEPETFVKRIVAGASSIRSSLILDPLTPAPLPRRGRGGT